MHILPIIFVNFVNSEQELLRYVQQNFASFGLLCFALTDSSNSLKCGEIYCCKFHGEYNSEKNSENRSTLFKVMNECTVWL